jgi:hypothetical protein
MESTSVMVGIGGQKGEGQLVEPSDQDRLPVNS